MNPTILKDELAILKEDMSVVISELNSKTKELEQIQIKIVLANKELAEVIQQKAEESARLEKAQARAVTFEKDSNVLENDIKHKTRQQESASVKYAQQEKNHRFHVITGYTDNYYKLLMFKPDGELEFTPNSYMSNFVVWDVLGAALPKNIEFVRYGSKRYMKVNCPSGEAMHYRVWDGVTMNFIPYEKDGVRYYALKNPIGEKKYLVDRSKAKREEVKRDLDAFANYAKVMMPLLS